MATARSRHLSPELAATQLAVSLVLLVGVPLLLAAVPGIACYLPARQAARLDPMAALR